MRGWLVAMGLLLVLPGLGVAQDEYPRALRAALQELAAGEVQAGRDRLAGLVRQAPQRTAAHCHLGSAHRMAGDLEAALAAFQDCARLAEHSQQPVHRARGLLGIAQVLAAQPARLGEAKEAFAVLLAFAEANDAIDAELVRARMAAIDAIVAADAAAAEVRARREERAREDAEAAAAAED